MELLADTSMLRVRTTPGERLPSVVDVLMEGFRTVSLSTVGERADLGLVELHWPPSLAGALSGRAAVVLRDAVDHEVVGSVDAVFTDDDRRLDLRDAQGRWQSVNKWGRLGVSFDGLEAAGELHQRLYARMQALIADLRGTGVEPFICYGTLLGLVRDGRLIAHDDDADLGYLSAHENPADIVAESYAIERALLERGHSVIRHSAGHLQLHFQAEGLPDHYLDVFTACRVEGRTYLCFQVGDEDLDLSDRVELAVDGHVFPAPADAERLLMATYGPGWSTPDPSFTFTTPPSVRSRLSTWFGEFNVQRDYWQDFYSSEGAERVPVVESTFVRWVSERLDGEPPVLDIGTGTCRDARFLSRKGHRVAAVDYSGAALERGRALAEHEGWEATFHQLNLGDLHAVGEFVAGLDWSAGWHLYARFLVHAIDDQARANLWTLAGVVASHGGECWFEFRTDRDEQEGHVFGEHFRRYLAPEQVRSELTERGLQVRDLVEGRGLAPHGSEDPWVARMRVGRPGSW
jgi:hypothetical protein